MIGLNYMTRELKDRKIFVTDMLWMWLKREGVVQTHQIIDWGRDSAHKMNHPLRRVQEWAAEVPPRCRRLTKDELKQMGWDKSKESGFVVCQVPNK
jgi:hypothetical protein